MIHIKPFGQKEFRIENGWEIAELFFRTDPSSAYGVSRKGYDAWILAHAQDPDWRDMVIPEDIGIINGSNMHMRSPLTAWQAIATGDRLPWIAALDPGWSTEHLSGGNWFQARDRILDAVSRMIRYRQISVAGATKILHMKRPYLVPILDSYVGNVLGSPKPSNKPAMPDWSARMLDNLHEILVSNRDALTAIQQRLMARGIFRTPVRILDAVLWSAEPTSKFGHRVKRREL